MKKIFLLLLLSPVLLMANRLNSSLATASVSVCQTDSVVLVIPPSFSPNGDGIDDVWEIGNIGLFPDATIKVYDRWGQVYFESTSFVKKWNGTNKGKPVAAGVYYYSIETHHPTHPQTFQGFINLIR